jgi:pilus assembly protein CpaC
MGQGKRQSKGWLLFLTALLLLAQSTGHRSLLAAEKQGDDDEEAIEAKPSKKIIQKNLTLSTGVSRTVEFQFDVGPINLTDPSLFEFRRLKEGDHERKILFIPKNPGFTDMTIHDSQGVPRVTYLVRVTREDIGNVISQLEELLGDIEGIKIKAVGGTIFIDGEILLPKDMIRIMRVVDAMKDRDPKKKEIPIRNTATISKITMNIIAERIEREVNSPEISARVLNNNILLEGTADGDFEADRAVEIAKTYLPEAFVEKGKGEGGEIKPKQAGGVGGGVPTIIDFLRVRPRQAPPPSQDIKITVNYVELNNDYNKAFNFEWKPLYQDGSNIKYDSSVGQITANLIATVSSLFPKLSTAKDHGHARILKQEQVIVKDRAEQPSSIESSITMYIKNVDERGVASLQAIPVQNFVKVRAATIQGSDSLELGIQVQLTNLVGQNGGQPMVATNSIQTQVTIKNGDSAALGGYAVDNALASYNREPTSSGNSGGRGGNNQQNTTALFDLQRSKSFNRSKQQYIIFVTPEILRTASQATEDITRKFRLNAGER